MSPNQTDALRKASGIALDPSESVRRELKRVVGRRLDRAIGRLDGLDTVAPEEIEEAVHEVRKRCKEVRAVGRLVREPIGKDFGTFNRAVRDAADELSSIRDAHAVLATFDDLRAVRGETRDPDLQPIRSAQAAAATAATAGLRPGDPRIRRARSLLTKARRTVRHWDVPDDSRWLQTAIERTYGRGQRDLRRARKQPSDERIHEWRKSVKTLWYQMRLLERAAPSILTPLIAQLDDLAEALGDDHDLTVLVERLNGDAKPFGGKKRVKRAVALARDQQDDLRRRAFRLGATLYTERPAAFASRVGAYWDLSVDRGPELATGGIAELIAAERREQSGFEQTAPARSVERERKFLVHQPPAPPDEGTVLRQGYVAIDGVVAVRVREAQGQGATLNIKVGRGAVRTELEWPITSDEFEALWVHVGQRRVHKTRYRIAIGGTGASIVELDVFHDELDGLVVAEVEFASDETMFAFVPPEWFGTEVTDIDAYTNASLAIDGRPGAATS